MTKPDEDVVTEQKIATEADKKKDRDRPPSKIVIRRMPPSLMPEGFLEQVSPLPDHDFFYFVRADMSLGPNAFTRAYINFVNSEDVFIFRDKFDGYVFLDAKGGEYPAVVEFSPFQKVPKKKQRKADAKNGIIEQDTDYKKFLDLLSNPPETQAVSLDALVDEVEAKELRLAKQGPMKTTTPLLDYLKKRREEKKMNIIKMKDERRRGGRDRDYDKRRPGKDDLDRPRSERDRQKERDRRRDRGKEKGREKDRDPPRRDRGSRASDGRDEGRRRDGKAYREDQEKPRPSVMFRFGFSSRYRDQLLKNPDRESQTRPAAETMASSGDKGHDLRGEEKSEAGDDRPQSGRGGGRVRGDRGGSGWDGKKGGGGDRWKSGRDDRRRDGDGDRPRSGRDRGGGGSRRGDDWRDRGGPKGRDDGRGRGYQEEDYPPRRRDDRGAKDRERDARSGGMRERNRDEQKGGDSGSGRMGDRDDRRGGGGGGSGRAGGGRGREGDVDKRRSDKERSEKRGGGQDGGGRGRDDGDKVRERGSGRKDSEEGQKSRIRESRVAPDFGKDEGDKEKRKEEDAGGKGRSWEKNNSDMPLGDSGADSGEKLRKPRKERPERQIYIPRKALERQRQESPQLGEGDGGKPSKNA